jgi:hypothetical protein
MAALGSWLDTFALPLGGRVWCGHSSTWRSLACFSWLCCWVGRSARRSWKFSCSDTSWRFCAGSNGERPSVPSIEPSSPRSHGRCREAPGRVCPCARRRCCAGTASWSDRLACHGCPPTTCCRWNRRTGLALRSALGRGAGLRARFPHACGLRRGVPLLARVLSRLGNSVDRAAVLSTA